MSPAGQASVEKIKKSTAQPSLSMETIRSIRVAVPPFAEQKRIVDRANELLAVCDELK
jgi:type I restriction enzyme S subunit